MTVQEAKREYNLLLKRYNKANEYFDNEKIPHSDKENFLKDFQEILTGLNYYLGKIEIYSQQQILGGM